MERKIYINYTELIKVCSWEQQTTLHKAMYLYDHSRRYIKRRVDGKDNITVLQIKFNDEEKLNKFLEIMRDEHIELINPETMEKIKEKINDYVHIVISKDKLEISEQYASIGVSGHSVYRNTDEYTYAVSKNERDGTGNYFNTSLEYLQYLKLIDCKSGYFIHLFTAYILIELCQIFCSPVKTADQIDIVCTI